MPVLFVILLLLAVAAPRRVSTVPSRHPRIAHFMPYLVGDSLAAIKRAKRLGFRYIDQNANVDADGAVWVLHWPRWRKQWTWYFTGEMRNGREVRAKVPASWPQSIGAMHTTQVSRLRSAKRGGTRPYPLRTHLRLAGELGIVTCLEVKGSPAFRRPEVWESMVKDAVATNALVIVMTLQNLPDTQAAHDRLTQAVDHGFPAALLPRGRKPADWDSAWAARGIKAWGRFR